MEKKSLKSQMSALIGIPVGDLSKRDIGDCFSLMQLLSDRSVDSERLLERLVSELLSGNNGTRPQELKIAYIQAIRAWRHASRSDYLPNDANQLPRSVYQANSILERMLMRHERYPKLHPPPCIEAVDALLLVCSTNPHLKHAEALVERILSDLEDRIRKGNSSLLPSTHTLAHAIDFFANQSANHYGAANKAEDYLLHFAKLAEDGMFPVPPNTHTFNRVLKAWSDAPEEKGADRAHDILRLMTSMHVEHPHVCPDTVSFVTVINAYSVRKQPLSAEEVYSECIEFYERPGRNLKGESIVLDVTSCFNATIFAWAQSGLEAGPSRILDMIRWSHSSVAIDDRVHVALMNSFIGMGTVDMAHDHLKFLVDEGVKSGDRQLLTTASFHTAMNAWTKSTDPEAYNRCRQVLGFMLQLSDRSNFIQPQSIVKCLNVLLLHTDESSPKQALELLDIAENQRALDFFVFQGVLNVLRKFRAYAVPMVSVLKKMEKYAQEHVIEVRSDILHVEVINALGRLKSVDAARTAVQILRDMKVRTSSNAFLGVLQALSNVGSQKALAVVSAIYAQAKSNNRLDLLQLPTHSLILSICSKSDCHSSTELASEVFNDLDQALACGRLGDERILRQVQELVSIIKTVPRMKMIMSKSKLQSTIDRMGW